MIALRLVRLIEQHSEELAHSLLQKIETNPKCSELRKIPRQEIECRAFQIYVHLSEWLLAKTEHDVEEKYVALGEQRFRQNIPFNHVFWGIILTKENLWDFLQSESIEESALDLRREFELLRILDQFFDRALYYVAVGYSRAYHEVLSEHTLVHT